MKPTRTLLLAATAAATLLGDAAQAHVEIKSGPAVSNVSTIVTFQVGHGCDAVNSRTDTQKFDTKSLTINIPTDSTGKSLVAGVRPMAAPALGGAPAITTGPAGVTSVTWTKPDAELAPTDTYLYTVQLYLKPATTDGSTNTATPPFSQIQFTAVQVCKDPATGKTATVYWDGIKHPDPWQDGTNDPTMQVSCDADTDCAAGTTCNTTTHACLLSAEPGPTLTVVDTRLPGWNHYTTHTHMPDPSLYFSDAQIVWMLTAQDGCTSPPCAYSANPAIMSAITMTPGVTPATSGIHPDGDIWVKY